MKWGDGNLHISLVGLEGPEVCDVYFTIHFDCLVFEMTHIV